MTSLERRKTAEKKPLKIRSSEDKKSKKDEKMQKKSIFQVTTLKSGSSGEGGCDVSTGQTT